MNNRYQKAIESSFLIDDRENNIVSFILNPPQNTMANIVAGMEVVRLMVLKARKEGMTSFFLALFCLDFLTIARCESYVFAAIRDDSEKFLDKVRLYLNSNWQLNGGQGDFPLIENSKYKIVSKLNGAKFSIATASQKSSIRGGTPRNVLFTEFAFYPENNVQKMLAGAVNSVPFLPGTKVIIETTANGETYFKEKWDKAEAKKERKQKEILKPVFFAAKDFYTPGQLTQLHEQSESDELFRQEYPNTPEEAFITTGSPFFDMRSINAQKDASKNREPIYKGDIAMNGTLFTQKENS